MRKACYGAKVHLSVYMFNVAVCRAKSEEIIVDAYSLLNLIIYKLLAIPILPCVAITRVYNCSLISTAIWLLIKDVPKLI